MHPRVRRASSLRSPPDNMLVDHSGGNSASSRDSKTQLQTHYAVEAANLQSYRSDEAAKLHRSEESMTNITGGCHCGAVRYEIMGEPIVHALCHCTDCRRHAGAPMVGWTMYPQDALKVTKGSPKV